MNKKLLQVAFCATAATIATTAYASDFGEKTEELAKALSAKLFGVAGTLDQSSTVSLTAAQADADPAALATVAKGLKVSVVSANVNLGAKHRPDGAVAGRCSPDAHHRVQRAGLRSGRGAAHQPADGCSGKHRSARA